MNIQRHLSLSTACRSPDEPAAPEPDAIEPVAEAVAEPIAEIQPEPELQPEPVVTHEDSAPKKTPWFQRVIAEVREEKSQERTLREAAERRASDLQAILERMQGGEKAPEAKPAAVAPAQNFDAAVKAEAAKQRLYDDTVAVRSAGEHAFKDFGETLQILNAVGATNDEFVSDLLAVDKAGAHKILDKLAKDPEKAASLVGMDSRRRIAELTRMADAPNVDVKPAAEAAKPAAISRAPTPKPAIAPLAAGPEVDPTTPDGNEKMDDKAWEAWYKSKYLKRA
jgi:hypothetical protein